jgi:hypothetical protein
MEPTLHRRRFGRVASILLRKPGSIEWHRAPSLRGGLCRRHRRQLHALHGHFPHRSGRAGRYKCRRGHLWAGAVGASTACVSRPEWACIHVAIARMVWRCCAPVRGVSLPSRPPHGEVGIQSGFGMRFDDLGRRPRLAASPQFDEQALLVLTTQRFRPISCERVHRVSVVVRFLQGLIAPWELRRLMRRLPTTPRLWVRTKSGIRPEADADYLARLRERAREKKASRSAAVNVRRFTATRRSRI